MVDRCLRERSLSPWTLDTLLLGSLLLDTTITPSRYIQISDDAVSGLDGIGLGISEWCEVQSISQCWRQPALNHPAPLRHLTLISNDPPGRTFTETPFSEDLPLNLLPLREKIENDKEEDSDKIENDKEVEDDEEEEGDNKEEDEEDSAGS